MQIGSLRPVTAHQHAIQSTLLGVIKVMAGFVQGCAVVNDQQVAFLIFVRIAEVRLRHPVGQVLQEILCFLRGHSSDFFGLALVEP